MAKWQKLQKSNLQKLWEYQEVHYTKYWRAKNMIDFTNKAITTKSDLESEQLLKKAVAQGFGLPKGEKALIANRFFMVYRKSLQADSNTSNNKSCRI